MIPPTSARTDPLSFSLMKKIRLGLIGAGKHGSRYAKHIAEDVPQAELVAVCRRNQHEGAQLAARYGSTFYRDYHQLAADERVDAVVVVVPPALHTETALATCDAGKHILIEKPFAISVHEARRIRTSIAQSGVRCMVAHTLRFNSVVKALKAHIPHIAPLHSLYLSQRFEPSSLPWLDCPQESGGGIILHTGIHSFDLLRFLSGSEVTYVSCHTQAIVTRKTEDNFAMTCRFNDPLLIGAVAGSRSTLSRSGLIELSGEQGQLVGDHMHGFAYLIRNMERTSLPIDPPAHTVLEVLRTFVDGLLQDSPFPITPDDGLRAVAIAEGCYRSAATGQVATIESESRNS
jgi:predicted dehydrogenase